MEPRRNLISWAALALAGLALLVALGGRFGGPGMMSFGSTVAVPAAPAAPAAPESPRFERGHGAPFDQELRRELRQGRGEGYGPAFHGRGFERGHRFGPLGMLFGLVGFLTKLVALGLLAWLLLRLFQQRRGGAPPAPPTTPAGHDPRVE